VDAERLRIIFGFSIGSVDKFSSAIADKRDVGFRESVGDRLIECNDDILARSRLRRTKSRSIPRSSLRRRCNSCLKSKSFPFFHRHFLFKKINFACITCCRLSKGN
jgi:hypothetical protein